MPDHLGREVHQRPARVARVDLGVGLDVVAHAAARHLHVPPHLPLAADDAGGDRLIEAERAADRQHPLADLQLVVVAETRRHQIARRLVEPDDRDVGLRVHPQRLGGELAPVAEGHLDVGGARDDVAVGDDVAARVHHHARAGSPLRARRRLRHPGAERKKRRRNGAIRLSSSSWPPRILATRANRSRRRCAPPTDGARAPPPRRPTTGRAPRWAPRSWA